MFWQMVKGAIMRQSRRLLLVALTVALGVSLATAMLNVMFDVGDKVNQELKAYGANIVVTPKNASVLKDVYGLDDTSACMEYLNESDLGKIKTIFWTNNIVAFAPQLNAPISLQDGQTVNIEGTWFDHQMLLPTGEYFSTGDKYLKSWWQVDGAWANDDGSNGVMVGKKLAKDLNVNPGDTITYKKPDGQTDVLTVSGIVSGGGNEESAILAPLAFVQNLTGLQNKIDQVEVSAVTTPENELARKAAANPKSLTMKEYEIWYCTSYVSSIAFQIEEVIPDSVAHPVRQIAESEGKILDKTQMLMLLITGLSLLSSILGVSNLVSANIMERSRELGLLKALGATNLAIVLLILTEIFLAGLAGGICGYFIGLGFAQIIGNTVFNSSIAINIVVVPIVAGLMSLVILLGSLPAIRMILSLRPAIVLHGR